MNPFEKLFASAVHAETKIDIVATTGGQVKTTYTSVDSVYSFEFCASPELAETIADMYAKAAKMARAAVEQSGPPCPEKGP